MTEHRKFDFVEAPILEPLSPELVLVDPQLAALARERLDVVDERAAPKRSAAEQPSRAPPAADDLGAPVADDDCVRQSVRERCAAMDVTFRSPEDSRPAAVAERDVDGGAASPADVDKADEWLFPSTRRRKRRRYAAVAFAAVLVFAAGGLVTWARHVWELNGSDAGGGTPNAVEPERVGGVRAPARDVQGGEPTGKQPPPAAPQPAPPVQSKKRPPKAGPAELPTRVFVWPAVTGATFYKVEFFRRGRKIFEATPVTTRIELPLRWVFRGRSFRLTPATYVWRVQAAFGAGSRPRYGQVVTRSTWTAQ
jgi:hypothetical protein